MDAPALTPGEERELAELRRLAYGPAGGIDPSQVIRLEHLEAAARPAPSLVLTAGASNDEPPFEPSVRNHSVPHPVEQESPSVAPVRAVRAESTVAHDSPDAASATRRLRTLFTRRWFVAVVAVMSVVAIISVVTQVGGPPSDLALDRVTVEASRAREGQAGYLRSFGLDLNGVEQFEDHRGLSVWAAPARDNRRCLVIEAGAYGVLGVSCTPRGLDPSVDVMVWLGMPSDIVGDLPNGSVMRFVLSSNRVLVWEQASDAGL